MVDSSLFLTNPQVKEFLQDLGLSDEQVLVYSALISQGTTTALKISRVTGLPRTTVYRISAALKNLGLAHEIVLENKTRYVASDSRELESRVKALHEKAQRVESLLPQMKHFIGSAQTSLRPETQVVFYKGKKDLEQLVLKSLNTSEIVGYYHLALSDLLDKKFIRKYWEELYIRKVKYREILSDDDPYLSLKNITKIRSDPLYSLYEPRYLQASQVKINHQVTIYNDVAVFYNWQAGEIFGIEIHNPSIASLQKQIFEILWGMAEEPELTLKRKAKEAKTKPK